ncbi:hypothetical protein Tco_1064039 [Tanacetum coccineum]
MALVRAALVFSLKAEAGVQDLGVLRTSTPRYFRLASSLWFLRKVSFFSSFLLGTCLGVYNPKSIPEVKTGGSATGMGGFFFCPKVKTDPSGLRGQKWVATSNVVTPNVEKTNDGFQMVGKMKKRKGKSKSTNGGQFTGPSVKHNVRYEHKATTSAPKKGTTYVDEEEKEDEKDVENVYDESANLIQNTKAGGNSSFTAAAS